jgi:hypothetical protein
MENLQSCLTNTLYGINLTNARDWNALTEPQWQHMLAAYSCRTLVRIIKKLYKIHNVNDICKSDLVNLWRPIIHSTLAWIIGRHVDDYWATVPRDIINIVIAMLSDTRTGTRQYRGKSSNFHIIYIRYVKTYFCGLLHSFNDQPAVIKIRQGATQQTILRWLFYGKYYYPSNNMPNQFIYDGVFNTLIWKHNNKRCPNCKCITEKNSTCQIRNNFMHSDLAPQELIQYNQHMAIINRILCQYIPARDQQYLPMNMPDWE